MAEHSSIEWTDATWNPITGCSVISPGCADCYAMKLAGTRLKHHPSRKGLTVDTKAGPVWNGKVRRNAEWMLEPLRWRKPRRIFVCAHGDLFHEDVPDAWIDQIFAVMCLAPWHTFQVLTKRAERMHAYFAERWQPAPAHDVDLGHGDVLHVPAEIQGDDRWSQINGAIDDLTQDKLFNQDRFWDAAGSLIGRPAWPRRPLPNVWLGVSAEDQPRADERIPVLLATPAAVRFVSYEPALGPVDFTPYLFIFTHEDDAILEAAEDGVAPVLPWRDPATTHPDAIITPRLDWVICGGENGDRPMHPDWARDARDACAAAQVPFFFKQWGSWATIYDRDKDDPDWRRCPRAEHQGQRYLNLAGGHGFHGERVVFVQKVGKAAAGRELDGRTHDAMPEVRLA